ncbi:MAG: hypothetical protein ACOY45_01195 [Pseudomonadota bacterium]
MHRLAAIAVTAASLAACSPPTPPVANAQADASENIARAPAGASSGVDPLPRRPPAPGTALPAPSAARYVGRWAANGELCAGGAWRFTRAHLTTAGEVSCEFGAVTAVRDGYDVQAQCLAEGTRGDETIRLRFSEAAQSMHVASPTFGPVDLIWCGQ